MSVKRTVASTRSASWHRGRAGDELFDEAEGELGMLGRQRHVAPRQLDEARPGDLLGDVATVLRSRPSLGRGDEGRASDIVWRTARCGRRACGPSACSSRALEALPPPVGNGRTSGGSRGRAACSAPRRQPLPPCPNAPGSAPSPCRLARPGDRWGSRRRRCSARSCWRARAPAPDRDAWRRTSSRAAPNRCTRRSWRAPRRRRRGRSRGRRSRLPRWVADRARSDPRRPSRADRGERAG